MKQTTRSSRKAVYAAAAGQRSCDSSRSRGNFDGPVMLASAMAGIKLRVLK